MSSKIAVRTVEILTPENAPFNLKSVCEAIHSAVAPLTGSPVMVTVYPEPRIVKGGLPDAEGHVGSQQGQGEPVALSAEVERLIAQCLEKDARIAEMDRSGSREIDTLRTQLAEAQALLRECQEDGDLFNHLSIRIDTALSASAEPSAPKLSEPVIPGHRLEALEALIADGDPNSDANVSNLNVAELISAVRTLQVRSIFVEPSAPVERIKLYLNVSNVHVIVNPDGSYTINPVEIDERAEFEKHYASKNDGFVPDFYDGEYDWHDAQPCWETWQARAALERNPCDLADVFDLESAAWMLRKHCHEELASAVERASAALKQLPSQGGAR